MFTDTSNRVKVTRLLAEQSVELSRQYANSLNDDKRLLELANNAIEASVELLKLPYPPQVPGRRHVTQFPRTTNTMVRRLR